MHCGSEEMNCVCAREIVRAEKSSNALPVSESIVSFEAE
jgi:hypothetical protein